MLEVKEVLSRADERQFLTVPFAIYRDDPNWVPPLIAQERRQWNVRHNPSLIGRPYWRFVARAGHQLAGRIVASIDSTFAQRWCSGAGLFGFFECVDDEQVAAALVGAAAERLAVEGVRTIVGPINLTTQNEVGLLTDGVDRPPPLLSPYNPPYYAALLSALGFRPLRTYHAYRWWSQSRPSKSVERLTVLLRGRAVRARLTVRAPRLADWSWELRRIHQLYNAAFENLWGYTPITWPEFEERAKRFRPFLRPDLVVLVELDERLVGFGLVLPDINMVLKRAGGRLLPFGWLALWSAASRIDRARFLLLGVQPEHWGSGLGVLIASEMARRCVDADIREVELSLVDAENAAMIRLIRASGCELLRTYTLYAKVMTN